MAQHWFVDHMEKLGEAGLDGLGKYLSVYRGIVMENVDPETLGRIQCCIPDLTDHFTYPKWIYPKGMYAGKTFEGVQYGCQVIPEIGDMVFITFEQGDLESPLWEHGYRGEDDVPTEEELTDVQSYWFKSPAGHILSISDTNKTITITHAKGHHIKLTEAELSLDMEQGHSIIINDEDGTITITHKNGQSVLINDKGISLISSKAVSLGSKDKSAEPSVLGDKNADVLSKLRDQVSVIANILFNKEVLANHPDPRYLLGTVTDMNDLAAVIAQVTNIAPLIPLTKSKKVTLD